MALSPQAIPGHCGQNLEKFVGLEDYGSIIWLPHQTIGLGKL
jgi:hypothetical protein